MRHLRNLGRRRPVQIFLVESGKRLPDLRKISIMSRKKTFYFQIRRGSAGFWRAAQRTQYQQQDSEGGNRQNYSGDRQSAHDFNIPINRLLKARSRRFTAGDTSL